MLTTPFLTTAKVADRSAALEPCLADLEQALGVAFTGWDANTGERLRAASGQPAGEADLVSGLVRGVNRDEPQFLADEDCVVLLAVPLRELLDSDVVAVAPFVTRPVTNDESLAAAARLLGCDSATARLWIAKQPLYTPGSLVKLASLWLAKARADRRAKQVESEMDAVTAKINSTYEEISLLHSLTQNLRISNSDEELGATAINWLLECLPAKCVAVQYLPVANERDVTYKARTQPVFVQAGESRVDGERFSQILTALNLKVGQRPFVANQRVTLGPNWHWPEIRQLVVVPLAERSHLFGWLAAFNHRDDGEFGTEEACLLGSVGAILGTHSGNRELYRQQAEFLADVVQAFTSAIDAKDPYTCGHSDRVARIAVRIAQELGADKNTLHTIYMAGLLHDIGKIGVSDAVLGKPGRLTDAEFEHIKLHPLLGHKILADLKQLADVLPAVLHHHEQWDGSGYPQKLVGEDIPWIARIMSVADSYDAMTSDRPYRKGMPEEKVDAIFRGGSDKQWDGRVIDAFFRARDDIRSICKKERAALPLNVEQWA